MLKVDLLDKEAKASDWLTSNFWVPELKGPIWLAPYQVEALDLSLEKDKSGDFKHTLIVWSDIKKSIKSTIAAGVALWRAFQLEWGSIKVVANDLKQAQSRSYFYLVRSLQLNPETANMIELGDIKITRYTVEFLFNHTKIEAIPADPRGEAGGNDDMVLFTELWTYMQDLHVKLWTETVVPPNKYGKSFRWAESYAGFVGQSVILEDLYKSNVKPEYQLDGTIAPLYENDSVFTMWNQEPRLPWQSDKYYKSQHAEISDEEFRRVHRNEWIGSVVKFIPDLWWDNSITTEVAVVNSDEPETVTVACDAAYAVGGDMFSIVVVGKHRGTEKLEVKEARFWHAGKDNKLEFKNVLREEDVNYPYGYVMDLAKRYRVLEVAYDPFQLHLMATEQNRKRIAFWKEFSQVKDRTIADNALYTAIKDGSLLHTDIPDLNEHIKNAGRDSNGRLVKQHKEQKIDGAVALSMAHLRARYYRL